MWPSFTRSPGSLSSVAKEQLAELWHRLPLPDLEIAELLG